MNRLVQDDKYSVVYGTFRGESNQELFRCPRELDDVDLKNYVNTNRCMLGFETDIVWRVLKILQTISATIACISEIITGMAGGWKKMRIATKLRAMV